MLVIENKSLIMQEVLIGNDRPSSSSGMKIFGVLGFIQIYPTSYLFVIKNQRKVYEISYPETIRIFEILDTELIVLNKEEGVENKEYVEAIKKVMKCGFYYSPDVDLSKRFMVNNDDQEDEWVRESEDLHVSHLLYI